MTSNFILFAFAAVSAIPQDPLDLFFDRAAAAETQKALLHINESPVQVKKHINPITHSDSNCPIASVAVHKCQEHATQACYNPALSSAAALALQAEKTAGLGASKFSFQACDDSHCQTRACDDPLDASSKNACVACLETCMNFCLVNTQRLCLQRVCAATVDAAVNKAAAQQVLAEKTVSPATSASEVIRNLARVADASHVSLAKLATIQKKQLSSWTSTFITRDDQGNSFCSDDALRSSDKVVVGPGGTSHIGGLVSCAKNYFSAERIKSTVNDPSMYKKDFTCSLAQTCPQNQTEIAFERATKVWDNLVSLYNSRLSN